MTSRRSLRVATAIAVLAAIPLSAYAQIAPNNPYSQTLVDTNRMVQDSLSQIIASQAQTRRLGGAPSTGYCSPLPPPDLMRGMDGHVPPELQSDPRYQEWLRCQNSP
jgi:hypothetical protein